MSRTVAEIQNGMDVKQASIPQLSSLDSPSQSAIYTLWKNITAYAIFVMENLWDTFKVELETIAANAPIGTNKWVQSTVFNFQYDATSPQILQLVNFVPSYNPVDATKRIVTRCSSITLPNKVVSVKVAKSEPPEALTPTEISSLVGYLDNIGFAGVQYQVLSVAPDELFLEAEIYYDGQYSAVIQANVIAAINAYLSTLPFDGIIKVSALEDSIQSVAGVKDLVINNMAIRANAALFSEKTYLVEANTLTARFAVMYAGYVIGETTSGNTFEDKLTFIVN